MHLLIRGQTRTFTDLKQFRADYGLPDTFGVNWFEPKDYAGLGRIDQAGADLNQLRGAMLTQLPSHPLPAQWLAEIPRLEAHFRRQLHLINSAVGLRETEIDFAVAGLVGVLETVVYHLIHAQATQQKPLPFVAVYGQWLNDSVRVASILHEYDHQGELWQIQIVNHAYGRVGMVIQTPPTTHYVADHQLSCPAEGFMFTLLHDLINHIYGVSHAPQ